MKRYIFLALLISMAFGSQAYAQDVLDQLRQRGRQALQREINRIPGFQQQQQQVPPKQQAQGYSTGQLPSEGGSNSGGGGQPFFGDNGFMLQNPNNGQPQYGQPQYGQPQYGQPQYGQPQYGQPQYGQPQQGDLLYRPYPQNQDRFGRTVGGGIQIVGGSPSSPVSTSQYILIRCPMSTNGSLQYTLTSNGNRYSFSMSGGQEQRFLVGVGWIISYNDGSQQRRYKLEGGRTYKLKRNSSNIWQLTANPLAK